MNRGIRELGFCWSPTTSEEILSLSDRIAVIHNGKLMGLVEDPDSVTEEQLGLMMAGTCLRSSALAALIQPSTLEGGLTLSMRWRVIFRRRFKAGLLFEGASPVLSVAAALVFAGGPLDIRCIARGDLQGHVPGALGSGYGLSEVVVKTIPLVISGIAVALAFRMKTWNIGAEGQIYLALATAAMVRYFHRRAGPSLLLTMTAGALLPGRLGIPGRVHEVAVERERGDNHPHAQLHRLTWPITSSTVPGETPSLGFPMTPPSSLRPAAAVFRHPGPPRDRGGGDPCPGVQAGDPVDTMGFEIRAIGDNPRAAVYSGIPYGRNVELVLFISGAIAGLAGMAEIAGLQGRLQPGFSPGYGYTAIIVAWLARLNPWAILVVSFFMGVLLVGGETIQVIMRLPLASVQVIQGCILFSVLGFEFFRNYRVLLVRKESD